MSPDKKDEKQNAKLVRIEVKYFASETEKDPVLVDSVTYTKDGLKSLKEIDPDPTNAIVLAVQLALKIKRFDDKAEGTFKIETSVKKGDLKVPEWTKK